MDLSKKRKSDEINAAATSSPPNHPTAAVLRPILDSLSKDQLVDILAAAGSTHSSVLSAIRSSAGSDISKRKLFVRGLSPDTTSDTLTLTFSLYGEIEEAVAVSDKATGKPRGFGFVIFRHVDGAMMALENPSKKIDGRMTVCQLAAAGNNSSNSVSNADVAMRKVYVGNIPSEVSAERLLGLFTSYGEVEEGPLGFDNQTGKPKRFAFFIYKTDEGARACLVDPVKNIDGQQVICKLAVDGKKGKVNGPNEGDFGINGVNLQVNNPGSGFMGLQKPYMNPGMPPSGPGFQPRPLYDGGYGPGGYGPGAQYNGPGSQYNGPGSQYNGPGSEYRGPGSEYRGPGSIGMGPGGGNYGPGYPSQMNQPGLGP